MKRTLIALTLALVSASSWAQAVIFPQEQQPGDARIELNGSEYTLANDLLTAKYILNDGKLIFGGCPELGLAPGTELFKVVLGDGTEIPASQMQMSDLQSVSLTAQPDAAKGSLRFPGHALAAKFKSGDLNVEWTAVLRNGSHYIRTELLLTADNDLSMNAVYPMAYNLTADSEVPVLAGTNRGEPLVSSKIFAGVESPMGINYVGSESNDVEQFNPKGWTPECFGTITPVPQGILSLGYSSDQVIGTQGYIALLDAGDYKFTFIYSSGNKRLNMTGVDIVGLDGTVVDSDYHDGYSGNNKVNNTYTVKVTTPGVYMLRYWVQTKTEIIDSSGNITVEGRTKVPVLVYDGAVGSDPYVDEGVFTAPASPVAAQSLSEMTLRDGDTFSGTWTPSEWLTVAAAEVPARVVEVGVTADKVRMMKSPVHFTDKGRIEVTFLYSKGNLRLDMCGVDVVNADGEVVASDYHAGFTGNARKDNVYNFDMPYTGDYTLRLMANYGNQGITSSGNITVSHLGSDIILHMPSTGQEATTPMTGKWSRVTTLLAGRQWEISSVVGLIAPGQPRRSFLAYNERERAVAWRPFPLYNSWYELNINRNNANPPTGNMNVNQCVDVAQQWKKKLYDEQNANIQALVWDDGWDEYGTWTFHGGFPNGFKEINEVTDQMNTGNGAWLGPVGGYGVSGGQRRSYWSDKGGMQLSNPAYYKVFNDAIMSLINDHACRFFKFDGISAQFSAVGPDPGVTGDENCEGIIDIEIQARKVKPDIFLNTTVGTWACPFWFHYTDAVWRQERDHGTIGESSHASKRDAWITYRDQLVYRNFVKGSPICPINNLMTHGLILTTRGSNGEQMGITGNTGQNSHYPSILREMHCAFACGSSMVELYCDYGLLNNIKSGQLWKDLAEHIKWQEKNKDVLPDSHWVGGTPWDGTKTNVYGWASWNGKNCVLTLRNGATSQQTINLTLRQALEIPEYVTEPIYLEDSFSDQAGKTLEGLDTSKPIDLDTPLSITLPASSVFSYDGKHTPHSEVSITTVAEPVAAPAGIYDLQGRRVASRPQSGLFIEGGKLTTAN